MQKEPAVIEPSEEGGLAVRRMETTVRRRALIVEDEEDTILFLTRALDLRGYEVVGTAATGERALEQVDALAPDFILMDIHIGGMNGLQATRRIMTEHPRPIIMVTGYDRDVFVQEARLAGACGYLIKPVSGERLDSEIRQAFERFAARLRRPGESPSS